MCLIRKYRTILVIYSIEYCFITKVWFFESSICVFINQWCWDLLPWGWCQCVSWYHGIDPPTLNRVPTSCMFCCVLSMCTLLTHITGIWCINRLSTSGRRYICFFVIFLVLHSLNVLL